MRVPPTLHQAWASFAAVMTVVSIASTGCAGSRQVPDSLRDGEGERLETLLERVRNQYEVPALAAALVQDGDIVSAAVGMRRLGQSGRVTVNDKFHIGSVSKPITATVIATLVEAGVLSWETTVADVFSGLASQINVGYQDVTVEQLLSHRAGITPWEEDEEIAAAPAVAGTPRQQRRTAALWLLRQAPVVEPGTEHVYSNAGYMVAAAMAEEVTDVAWEQLVADRLAKPLGLESIGFGWPARADPAQPWGHRFSANRFVPHAPDDSYQVGPLLGPAGDLHMNITDLARFAQLHLEGLRGRAMLLRPATFQKLHRPIGDYALGWNVRETADHHIGGAETFIAAIWVSVPRNVAIVVASNADANGGIVSAVINETLRLFDVPKP